MLPTISRSIRRKLRTSAREICDHVSPAFLGGVPIEDDNPPDTWEICVHQALKKFGMNHWRLCRFGVVRNLRDFCVAEVYVLSAINFPRMVFHVPWFWLT